MTEKQLKLEMSDYEKFVDKFKPKLTTDDCYTPIDVYDAVLNWVAQNANIEGLKVVRPFYPGGDYENENYEDCVVVDNPPFSIITQICRFYLDRNTPFLLFAPHLTLFSADIDLTRIVVSADITYHNGAVVKTSFLTNLFENIGILGAPELREAINSLKVKSDLPKYVYPHNVLTVSKISYFVEKGIGIQIDKSQILHYRALDEQRRSKKGIFGAGFLVSDGAAAEVKKATEAASRVQKATIDGKAYWNLSDKEKQIIEMLNIYD